MVLKEPSGTSDTGRGYGCPCGRSHPGPGRARKLRAPVAHGDLTRRVYDALANGKAELDDQRWIVRYAGNCESPIAIPSYASTGALIVRTLTRCRRCKPCLRARQFYWGYAAMKTTEAAQAAGLRTWFGTLTLSPESQQQFLNLARVEYMATEGTSSEFPKWLDEVKCDERFKLVRIQILKEVQRFWKRLRKQGHEFKYFLVFERHKSGLPHMHFLMHETAQPILKRDIQSQWPWGFTNVSIVGGKASRAAAPEKAAWYVVKYLSKSIQARQIASTGYAKDLKLSASSQSTPQQEGTRAITK